MDKILGILFFCILFLSNMTANALTTSEYVNGLEKRLFGTNYPQESINKRIDRIEMQIYDNNYTGTPAERLEKIDKIYPKAEFENKGIKPLKQAVNSSNYTYEDDIVPKQKSDYNSYPVISQIEESMYKKNFQGEDIYNRLARLEKELYGNVKSTETLQARVESLKKLAPKKQNNIVKENFEFNNFKKNNKSAFESDVENYSELSMLMGNLEKQTFHRTYEHEIFNKRLDRLEQFYFGETSPSSASVRLKRLSVIIGANDKTDGYYDYAKASQWAGILMNLLMIGLGFLL